MKRHSLNCIPFTSEEVFLVKFIHIDVNSDACDKQCCQFLSLISIKLIYLHIRRCISTRLMFARFLRGMFRINLEWPQSFSTKTFKKTQKRMVKLFFSEGLGLSSSIRIWNIPLPPYRKTLTTARLYAFAKRHKLEIYDTILSTNF